MIRKSLIRKSYIVRAGGPPIYKLVPRDPACQKWLASVLKADFTQYGRRPDGYALVNARFDRPPANRAKGKEKGGKGGKGAKRGGGRRR